MQLARDLAAEAGADLADIDQRLSLASCQMQGGNRTAIRYEADDGKGVLLHAFDLHPCLASARAVGTVAQLAHQTLQAHGAGVVEDRLAMSFHMGAEDDGAPGFTAEFPQGRPVGQAGRRRRQRPCLDYNGGRQLYLDYSALPATRPGAVNNVVIMMPMGTMKWAGDRS